MGEGGRRLKRVFDEVLPQIRAGVSKKEIDQKVEELILKFGGEPSFKMVPGYHWASCITVNEEVVHGIPNEYLFKEGDMVSLDAGMYYKGFHTDRAETIKIQDTKFLEVGKFALKLAIGAARPGNRVGHISLVIQKTVEKAGFNVVRSLTGHGVGKKLHEEPQIPCFLKNKLEKTPLLKEGMTLAIEVIYCTGSPNLALSPDHWTLVTKDGKIAGLFEETIAVTGNGPLVLTRG